MTVMSCSEDSDLYLEGPLALVRIVTVTCFRAFTTSVAPQCCAKALFLGQTFQDGRERKRGGIAEKPANKMTNNSAL